jgi:N6-L-threonylcarbamoyladenine synthase
MRILAIETSCDETSVAITDITDDSVVVHAHITLSQVEKHREYGGVFPSLAKREHAQNIVPILEQALNEAELELDSCEINENQKRPFGKNSPGSRNSLKR